MIFLQVGHLLLVLIDCSRHLIQNTCPQIVEAITLSASLSIHIGHSPKRPDCFGGEEGGSGVVAGGLLLGTLLLFGVRGFFCVVEGVCNLWNTGATGIF